MAIEQFAQLKQSEIKSTKIKILETQRGKCAICGRAIMPEDSVLDHQHKFKKSDPNIENGNGLIRGVLCQKCNPAEGKCFNAMFRYLQIKTDSERIQWLENLIEYYKQSKYPLIHPTEVQKKPFVSKRNFNNLNRVYTTATGKKPLEYPKSGKLTKPLKVLFEKYGISPYN